MSKVITLHVPLFNGEVDKLEAIAKDNGLSLEVYLTQKCVTYVNDLISNDTEVTQDEVWSQQRAIVAIAAYKSILETTKFPSAKDPGREPMMIPKTGQSTFQVPQGYKGYPPSRYSIDGNAEIRETPYMDPIVDIRMQQLENLGATPVGTTTGITWIYPDGKEVKYAFPGTLSDDDMKMIATELQAIAKQSPKDPWSEQGWYNTPVPPQWIQDWGHHYEDKDPSALPNVDPTLYPRTVEETPPSE